MAISKKVTPLGAEEALVLTASTLKEGHIVWRGEDGQWVRSLNQAILFNRSACEIAMEQASAEANDVVGIYAVIVRKGSPPLPLTIRERIRAFGPTIHPHFFTDLSS